MTAVYELLCPKLRLQRLKNNLNGERRMECLKVLRNAVVLPLGFVFITTAAKSEESVKKSGGGQGTACQSNARFNRPSG
jgi:hypothetical protein